MFKYYKKNKFDFKNYYLDIPIFEDITSIWSFIISKIEDDDYAIEKFFAFSLIYKYLETPSYYKEYLWWSYKDYLESDFKDTAKYIIITLKNYR